MPLLFRAVGLHSVTPVLDQKILEMKLNVQFAKGLLNNLFLSYHVNNLRSFFFLPVGLCLTILEKWLEEN